MRKTAVGAFAAAVAATGMLLPATASAATQSTDALRSGHLRNQAMSYNQCMVHLSNGSRGNNPSFYDCLDFDDQVWYFPAVGTTGPIINKYSLLYMTAQNWGTTPAFLYYNSGFPDQQWKAEYIGTSGMVQFRNTHSQECLSVDYGGNTIQQTCNSASNQAWWLG
ncbi:RICIN domain-containing protein [Kitasatospora sp. NPDC101183]|uniref:RICIN domain-containing protein n=1 Tax=Kitasatospora sp. NPDC101183 TaxID=3364100 RepID=UPI00381DA3C6